MSSDYVDRHPQQVLKILLQGYDLKRLSRHFNTNINITAIIIVASRHRAEHTH